MFGLITDLVRGSVGEYSSWSLREGLRVIHVLLLLLRRGLGLSLRGLSGVLLLLLLLLVLWLRLGLLCRVLLFDGRHLCALIGWRR